MNVVRQSTSLRAALFSVLVSLFGAAHGVPTVVNAGFETPTLDRDTWGYRQTNITAWTLSGQSGAANGRTPWSSVSHSGNQYIFIQSAGNPGRVSQQVTGFEPGKTYRVRFWMLNRTGGIGSAITVLIDNVPVSTPQRGYGGVWIEYVSAWFVAQNQSHLLSFTGEQTGSDISSILDDITIDEFAVSHLPLQNGNFEEPDLGLNRTIDFPQGFSLRWNYDPKSGLGIGANGLASSGAAGKQYAFLRDNGTVSQTVGELSTEKSYCVRFFAAKAQNALAQLVNVIFDGQAVLSEYRPDAATWKEAASTPFTPQDGFGDLVFKGGLVGGGVSLIDLVRFQEVSAAPLNDLRVVRGKVTGGSLGSLVDSDDGYLSFAPGFVLNSNEPPVMIEVTGNTGLRNLDYMCLQVESRASSANLGQTVELYDFEHARYVRVDSQILESFDRRRVVIKIDDAPSFLDPMTGNIRCRLSVRAVGPLSNPEWTVSFDQVSLAVAPFGGQQ